MSKTRDSKAWNIMDPSLASGVTGHHHWEAKAFADELVRRGEKVRIFTNMNAPDPAPFAGSEIIPTFSTTVYGTVSNDPVWSATETFVVHNRSFERDLLRLDPSMFEDAITLFPTLSENQCLGLVRWLAKFPVEKRPRVAVSLRAPQEFVPSNSRAQYYRAVLPRFLSQGGPGIAIFSRTTPSAAMFEKLLGTPINVFPFLAPDDLLTRRQPAPTNGPMVVSFVGGARRERGSAHLPDIVARCAGLGVQFFIQVRSEGVQFDPNILRALSGLPHVRLHDGPMARNEYYDAIANSVVLLAYHPESYRWRDSGVFHEAKLLDAPVLVAAGTWMEQDVKALGNGLVIPSFTPNAAVESIMRAQRELPALRAAAARVGRDMREKNGVARCLEAFANACSSRA
jgi:hypothetical protein